MNIKKCVKCGTPKESRIYGTIWLSQDGLCSVCNNKYKDRPRTKPFFEFKLKDVEYKHLDSQGVKLTDNRILRRKFQNKAKSGGIITALHELREYKKKQNKTLEEFL